MVFTSHFHVNVLTVALESRPIILVCVCVCREENQYVLALIAVDNKKKLYA